VNAYGPLAAFYDDLTTDVPYERFADYYEAVFQRCGLQVKTVLDMACGTGSMTKLLADRGYEMIAADASAEMLAVAREKTAGCPVAPLLLNQSFEELDLYGTVDAEVCCLDGVNYIEPESLDRALHRLWLFLEPGGVLIFDVNTPEKLRALDGQVFFDETDDVFCLWRTEVDPAENVCIYGMDLFSRQGELWRRDEEEHREYLYEPEYLRQRLLSGGFVDVRILGELSFLPPGPGEQRIMILARKPKDGEQYG
jgi:SAM-dependent methyltransferase